MSKDKNAHAVRDLVAAFEEGHVTKLTTEDRKYVTSWLKVTRPYMRKVDVAKLLGVSVDTITQDWKEIDNSLADSMQAIDVGLILAQYGAQVNLAIQNIHKSIGVMEETDKGRTTATYLQFVKAPSEIIQNWVKTLKDVGLIGEDGSGAQEEYSWKTITSKDGVVTSEATHRINKDIERAKNKAFEPGLHRAPNQIEGEIATENTQSDSDTSIN